MVNDLIRMKIILFLVSVFTLDYIIMLILKGI